MLRAIILIVAFVAVKGDNCVPRSFGQDRIVCVCNASYCDSPEQSTLNKGQFQWYVSTKKGKRLQFSVNNFATKSNGTVTLIVDKNEMFQEICGFGGAMTDAAAINIRSLSNETQHKLLESYYGFNGIGYTFCRVPIAGTDFSTRPYTYDDVPDDDTLSHFQLVEEDNYKITHIRYIQNIMSKEDTLRIFTTSWTAPKWMKTSNDIKWGFLKPEYYQLYANYCKKFFDEYKEHGINIWGITPGNEPIDGFFPFFYFNAMGWSPKEEAKWTVNYLEPTLSQAGYKPIYMLPDDQRLVMSLYVNDAFKQERAKEVFSGIAYHWYTDNISSPLRLNEIHNKYPDKFILMSEACEGSQSKKKVIIGSWERGEHYIQDIIESLTHWVCGWVDWNIALDKDGGPNWAKNNVDSPIIVNSEMDEFYKQPMFYAIAHVSKFVPRGSVRIHVEDIGNENIKAAAFLTPEDKIVVVIVNKGDKPFDITLKDNSTDNIMNLLLPATSFNTLLYLS